MGSSPSEVLFISVNHSITLMGKVWFIVMVFLRILVLVFAGYPLYQDEQERFVCNTIQPGCANVCYDLFSPVSLFRFWLVQLITLCLPYIIFVIYVLHKVSRSLSSALDSPGRSQPSPQFKLQRESWPLGTFTGAYVVQLLFRTLLEAGFGAAHHYLFGFYIPRRFLCQHAPCTTQVDCYISRPTEKTVMLSFMLGMSALCLFLNILDFICAAKRSVKQKSRRKMMVERMFSEEQCFLSAGACRAADPDSSLPPPDPEVQAGKTGSFRKRCSSAGHPDCNAARADGCSLSPEEPLERNGSEVALCPREATPTPRSIRVNKRCRLKPPPPPRRDQAPPSGRPADLAGDDATAVCIKRVGHYTLVELNKDEDGPEKRSEWV
ncbi:gap junction delta-4 protein [Cololabis saira]|uniref:gap junction delta-4 protein n=1 Tax=Cololabis saira TaxID=129043 RepID=UPI002AD29756|nr:gap junction delta-4 protein [Cololabis saira]